MNHPDIKEADLVPLRGTHYVRVELLNAALNQRDGAFALINKHIEEMKAIGRENREALKQNAAAVEDGKPKRNWWRFGR